MHAYAACASLQLAFHFVLPCACSSLSLRAVTCCIAFIRHAYAGLTMDAIDRILELWIQFGSNVLKVFERFSLRMGLINGQPYRATRYNRVIRIWSRFAGAGLWAARACSYRASVRLTASYVFKLILQLCRLSTSRGEEQSRKS